MKTYAQNQEDLFILELFKGIKRKLFYVELGAGDGVHFSNCKLLKENGWEGISIDADPKGNRDVIQAFITRENVISLLPEKRIDFLSLDLDSIDYYVLEEILKYRLVCCVCCEVNSQLPVDKNIRINYVPNREWDKTYAYGMSYLSAMELLKEHGFSVIKNMSNTNLIAVGNHLIDIEDCGHTFSHEEKLNDGLFWIEK